MVSVKTVLDLINFISNKETAGNTMKIDEFNTLCKGVNVDIFKQCYGLPEEYRPGQPMPRMAYEITKKLMDDLHFLKVRTGVEVSPMILDQYGRADIPSNYLHLSSALYNEVVSNECNEFVIKPRDIELLTDAQRGNRLSNSITMPTKQDPCMAMFNTYFEFYPKDLREVEMTYLRMPAIPIYGYTIDEETDEYVYDPNTSQDFEFPEDKLMDIVRITLSYIQINLQNFQITSYIEAAKEEGI